MRERLGRQRICQLTKEDTMNAINAKQKPSKLVGSDFVKNKPNVAT